MRRASIGRRTSDGTINAAALEIIAPPTGNGVLLREMDISLVAATASVFALGRPAAKGINPTTPVSVLVEGGDLFSVQTKTAIAWGTGPTAPTQFYTRTAFPANIGAFIAWIWDNGIFIPAGATIVLWNLAANSLADVTITIDE